MRTSSSACLVAFGVLGAAQVRAQVPAGENGGGAFVSAAALGGGAGEPGTLREAALAGRSIVLTGRGVGAAAPATYVVRSGDTLWDICAAGLGSPWLWPQVWSLNPEITNPHWIYPGQVVRLRRAGVAAPVAAVSPGDLAAMGWATGGAVLFRIEGFVEKDMEEVPGSIVASWEDEMLLAYPDLLYVRFREGFPVQAGQQYTIYRPRETVYDTVEDEEGDPVELGRIVEILGIGVVASFDPDARLARLRVIESVNPIERGDSVGPVQRNFVVSEPRAAEVDLDGTIVASLRPRALQGQGFVVFVNRGSEAGVRDGNRFQIIRANDHYRSSRGMDVPVDLPFEWIGECQVLEARRLASTCIVTASRLELGVGDRVNLIRGH